ERILYEHRNGKVTSLAQVRLIGLDEVAELLVDGPPKHEASPSNEEVPRWAFAVGSSDARRALSLGCRYRRLKPRLQERADVDGDPLFLVDHDGVGVGVTAREKR